MATVKARKRKKGTVYCAEIRIKGHPSLSQTFERKSEAYRWAEETETALRNNGYLGNAPQMIYSLMMPGQKYLAEVSAKKAPSTHRRELAQDKPLQYFHGHTLKDITPTMVAQFRDWRLGAVQAGTVIKRSQYSLSHFHHRCS